MLTVRVHHNLPDVQRAFEQDAKQARFAAMRALNEAAKDVQKAMKEELPRVFDRPTPYISNSIRITSWATRDKLSAVIEPKYMGGKGVDPQKVLAAEIFGGPRRLKRSEVALRRVGILPDGYVTVPGAKCPLDEFGNVKGSFVVQLLSYFQALGEQGYKSNMTAKRKARLAKRGLSAGGYRTINGVEYFVSYGKLRGGVTGHLHPGIWSRKSVHGAVVEPVLMFVKRAQYRPRFDFFKLGERVFRASFPARFDAAFDAAMRTAR